MSSEPLVSIVVDNFDYDAYVAAAIDSALAQTYRQVEVVVVDDGSRDGSCAVIERYRGRVELVLKENGGQASALNAGFARSRGDIVLFLDADDRLDPAAAARVAAAWRPGVARVQYRLRVIDGHGTASGQLVPPAHATMPSGDLRAQVALAGAVVQPPTSGNAFARRVLERIMPIPEASWRISADAYLLSRSAFHGAIVSIDEPLGEYRLHGSNRWAESRDHVARITQELRILELREAVIAQEAQRCGLPSPSAQLWRQPYFVALLLALGGLAPESQHHGREPAWRLGARGVRAALGSMTGRPAHRLVAALTFASAALLPRASAGRLGLWYAFPTLRPVGLRRLLELVR